MATKNSEENVREAVFSAIEASLDAQLRAVRRLRLDPNESKSRRPSDKGMSQVDMAEDILRRAGGPLHANDIIEQIKKIHGVEVDRESLVSALSKRLQRGDRFVRSGPNQFALGPGTRRSR